MSDRANPFGNLDDFAPAPAKQKANRAVIDQVAEEHGFPSRQPAKQTNAEIAQPAPAPAPPRQQRRRRTGRNAQINIKATPEAIDDLYRLADKEGKTLSEIFELALAAFERELKS
jgi:hypothetical protein